MRTLRLVFLSGIAVLLGACVGSSTSAPTEQQEIIQSIESTDALPMDCAANHTRRCDVATG